MGAVIGDFFDEMFGGESLSVHPPVVVGEGGDHGVDLSRVDPGLQFLHVDHAPQYTHAAVSFGPHSEGRE
jgi:hypothetical protein